MGYVSCFGTCLRCGKLFGFHPNKVPSIRGEPVCKECVDKANPLRIAKGLKPITYSEDAYSCVDENEVNWGDD
jgi:hypothetical protein